MELIRKIASPYFNNNKNFFNYLNQYEKDDKKKWNTLSFLKRNTQNILINFPYHNNFLVYGDVQSGKTRNLIYLTEKICEKYNYNFILYLSGNTNEILFQNQERFFDAFKKIDSKKYKNLTSRSRNKYDKNLIYKNLVEDKVVIMHSLKRPDTLKSIYETLKNFKDKIKILIIDDEGDDASLASGTKERINKFFEINNYTKKISISASPFINLYKQEKVYDYFHILEPNIGYTSIFDFNWQNYKIESKENDEHILYKPLLEWIIQNIKTNRKKSQILFNFFNQTKKQEDISEKIKYFIYTISRDLEETERYLKMFDLVGVDSKKVSLFAKKVFKSIFIFNGKNKITLDDLKKYNHQIIIGGIKLSRGITFEHLTFEVMVNMGNKIDAGTLIQRARWLGYRENINEIKIYMTSYVFYAFEEIKKLIKITKNYKLSDKNYKKIIKDQSFEKITLKK